MQAKSVLYAAVGAPVVAARKMTDQVNGLRGRVSKETSIYTEAANKTFEGWANEGEKVVSRISEGKVVEEISSKVDLDQAKEQVGKLRDQLEDMLATWRTSFRPESATKPATSTGANDASSAKSAAKPAAKKAAAKKPTAKKPAAKPSTAKTTSAKSGTKSAAAKTSTAKTTSTKAKSS